MDISEGGYKWRTTVCFLSNLPRLPDLKILASKFFYRNCSIIIFVHLIDHFPYLLFRIISAHFTQHLQKLFCSDGPTVVSIEVIESCKYLFFCKLLKELRLHHSSKFTKTYFTVTFIKSILFSYIFLF